MECYNSSPNDVDTILSHEIAHSNSTYDGQLVTYYLVYDVAVIEEKWQ